MIGCLDCHELHRRPLHCLGDCLCITEVVLLALGVGTDVLRWHQPRIVTETLQASSKMMCADASLHADETGRKISKS